MTDLAGDEPSGLHPALLYHVVNTLEWPSLRPLQREAALTVGLGHHALLLAPTAGGKTEAATFPLLSRAVKEQWSGLSILYLCPLRALLNNLEPRVATYAQWLGLRAQLWHGDTGQTARSRILTDPPEILLTTPESLEAMLVSTRVDPEQLLGNVQAVVVDEVHAFAGDDRGWHLLAVLARLEHLAGRRLQRVGLSATVGNPDELLTWLQGGNADRKGSVVAPDVVPVRDGGPPSGSITLDHVGSLDNAALVISKLHLGEKRLVFCESRRQVEDLAQQLRLRGVTTFVSHSSLSRDERHRAEQAFAEARDCVIVSTSTLELGIDVGDLDRVIQIDAPRTVASFLQRLGRTGRRAGTQRNALFLATTDESLLRAAALLHLWGRGYVERVVAPASPRHIVAQQVLAACLQDGRIGRNLWHERWGALPLFDDTADAIVNGLLDRGMLEVDQDMIFIGPEAEHQFGRRHFMELSSVFTAKPEFMVLHGRQELGSVDPMVLTRKVDGPRLVVLAGRSWQVNHIDWKRRRCFVEPSDGAARMKWASGFAATTYAMAQAQREVLLGSEPPVEMSRRASAGLEALRQERAGQVSSHGLVVSINHSDLWWWTWAGGRANATLQAALPNVIDPRQQVGDLRVRLLGHDALKRLAEVSATDVQGAVPQVTAAAIAGLKFSDVLPLDLARQTVALRLVDYAGAVAVLGEPRVMVR